MCILKHKFELISSVARSLRKINPEPVYNGVRENVCNNSKNVKSHVVWIMKSRIPSGIWSRLYGSFPSALNTYRTSSQQCARGALSTHGQKFDLESLYYSNFQLWKGPVRNIASCVGLRVRAVDLLLFSTVARHIKLTTPRRNIKPPGKTYLQLCIDTSTGEVLLLHRSCWLNVFNSERAMCHECIGKLKSARHCDWYIDLSLNPTALWSAVTKWSSLSQPLFYENALIDDENAFQ